MQDKIELQNLMDKLIYKEYCEKSLAC